LKSACLGPALTLIRQEDRGRKRYLKKYFGKDIDDPLSYHLILNTDGVGYEEAARLIGDAALGQSNIRPKPDGRNQDSFRP
jgi:cytidylate kinase